MAADRDDRNPTRPLGVPDPGPAEDESAGPAKPDIRVSRHEDLGVEVRRDLTGGGRLARGDHTNMSRLSFSAKAKPRDWLDPELEALRDAPAPETAAAATRGGDAGGGRALARAGAAAGPGADDRSRAVVGEPALPHRQTLRRLSARAMTIRHVVQPGEHLSRIAAQYGFHDYTPIWSFGENAELKKKRKDPHILLAGDVVAVPAPRRKTVTKPTGAVQRFQLAAPIIRLELRLQDPFRKPIAGVFCDLRVDAPEGSAVIIDENRQTDGDGRLGVNISRTAFEAELQVFGKEKPLPSPVPRPPMSHKFDLFVGGLDPVTEKSGLRARLNNLGYFAGLNDGREDREQEEQLRWAIEEFQLDHDIAPQNGDFDDAKNPTIVPTRRKLVEAHGDREPL